MSRQSRYCEHFIYACLLLFAFSLPFSIAASQGALILGIIGWGFKAFLERKIAFGPTPVDRPIIAFLAAVIFSAFWGADVLNSLTGIRTFWTFLIIYILYANVWDPGRVKILAGGLFAGAALSAVHSASLNALELSAGVDPDLLGNMSRAGQFMMVCGLASGCMLYRKDRRGRLLFALLTALLAAAVLLEFKRGAWFGLFCVFAVQGAVKSPKFAGLVLAAVLAIAALFAPARERLTGLEREFRAGEGGRGAMWLTAPAILRDYPLGAGLDNAGALMYSVDPAIELKEGVEPHSHLHNSYLQVLVETGPLGFAAFIFFIAAFLRTAVSMMKRIADRYPFEKGLALGSFSAFAGFLGNGLFEHNFGDSEVAMLVYFFMGAAYVIDRRFRDE